MGTTRCGVEGKSGESEWTVWKKHNGMVTVESESETSRVVRQKSEILQSSWLLRLLSTHDAFRGCAGVRNAVDQTLLRWAVSDARMKVPGQEYLVRTLVAKQIVGLTLPLRLCSVKGSGVATCMVPGPLLLWIVLRSQHHGERSVVQATSSFQIPSFQK